jgi:hypothetical protein
VRWLSRSISQLADFTSDARYMTVLKPGQEAAEETDKELLAVWLSENCFPTVRRQFSRAVLATFCFCSVLLLPAGIVPQPLIHPSELCLL